MPPMRVPRRLRPLLPLLALCALLGATAAAYSPGLSGPFMLDDLSVLPKLGAYGPVDNPTTFVSYVTDGIAGPTGRPLALASFLIDAHDWPARPWAFKLTNVLLHLLNGVVLALLLRLLSRSTGLDRKKAAWAGVLGAGFWLLHPLFVSTTLYVVQRMAELAALFVFSGLALYTSGRWRMAEGRRRSGYALMTCGLIAGTGLGVLAKENAALLPVLAAVLEFTVFAAADRRTLVEPHRVNAAAHPPSPWFRWLFLGLPTLAILAYLAWELRNAGAPIPYRHFTIGERLLTEPRVLVRYLYLLIVPHAGTSGLFTTIQVSRGPFHPWTTLPAVALIIGLIAGAIATRRRWPVLCAAVLFFFAGQLLESTTIPLELYFEHRNYLPAALAFWPLAVWIMRRTEYERWIPAVPVALFTILALLTAYRASLWGNGLQLALTWMHLNPHSPRAIVWGSEALEAVDRPGLALARLRRASRRNPDSVSIAFSRLRLACATGESTPADLAAALHAARRARTGSELIYRAIPQLAQAADQHSCPPLTPERLQALPSAALRNPHFASDPALRQEFWMLRGRLYLAAHQPRQAFPAFAAALELDPRPDTALVAAAELYAAHAPRLALRLLDRYRTLPHPAVHGWTMSRLHHWWLVHISWYRRSFHRVRAALQAALRAQTAPTTS